jgi:hypothetical protein
MIGPDDHARPGRHHLPREQSPSNPARGEAIVEAGASRLIETMDRTIRPNTWLARIPHTGRE